jgi:hypothetical protein
MNSHTSKERAEAKHIFKNTLAQSTFFFLVEYNPLCLIIYKVNKLFIVAVKNNNIVMFDGAYKQFVYLVQHSTSVTTLHLWLKFHQK